MRFSCEKAVLEGAVAVASRAVARKSSLPALEGLLIRTGGETLTISGYNLQTGIRAKIAVDVAEPGEIVLNAKLLNDIIRRMPDDVVTVANRSGTTARLQCGDADFEISVLSTADFPDLPEMEAEQTVSIQQRTLRAMVAETSFAISTNASRPVLTGALFEAGEDALTVVAVDGFRLALRKMHLEVIKGRDLSFIVPGPALNEVRTICSDTDDLVEIALSKQHILFTIGDVELICRRLSGEFLDYRSAIPQNNPIAVIADPKALTESLNLVSTIVSEKDKASIRCRFQENRVQFSARTNAGDAKDICRLEGDGGGLEIAFNGRYLLEALRYAPADVVRIELNTDAAPAIIVPADGKDHFLYMVLPVRLKGGTA